MDTDLAIIGGGLSGLALADGLNGTDVDWQLFEARDRLGGRVLSIDETTGIACDLGPSWVWPQNRRILSAVQRFGLSLFEQHAVGHLVYQDETGAVQRDLDFATMAGSLRMNGGLGEIVRGFAATLPTDRLNTSHALRAVQRETSGLRLVFGDCRDIRAKRVAFALPLRLLEATVSFEPALSDPVRQAMTRVPTWMAGQAKLVAIYPTPFWRSAGLSGDAISRRGPMAEIHDASPAAGAIGALFGFLGMPAPHRHQQEAAVEIAAREQLTALFGPEAQTPIKVLFKDWAFEPFTAIEGDHQSLSHHPAYGMLPDLQALWDDCLLFAGTEVASSEGGLLEGALEAADACLGSLGIRPVSAA